MVVGGGGRARQRDCHRVGRAGASPTGAFQGVQNISGVIGPYGITVLSTLITLKFVHLKFQQNYEYIEHASIYHHAKFELEQKFVQEETKKRNLHLKDGRCLRALPIHIFVGILDAQI